MRDNFEHTASMTIPQQTAKATAKSGFRHPRESGDPEQVSNLTERLRNLGSRFRGIDDC